MCTAITYCTKDHYFGRSLDLDHTYEEAVAVAPRNYLFPFREVRDMETHFAMIGMARVVNGYPLYYEGLNEAGLAMAGLNFPDNAVYHPVLEKKNNIAPFEFIPWVLGQCRTLGEARYLLEDTNVTDLAFSAELPPTPLHWLIAGREGTLVAESVADGLKVYDNPVGVLTNNPPFETQMFYLSNFRNLTSGASENRFSKDLKLSAYSRGMGAMGLPGDLSSASRFVRAAFTKLNSVSGDSEDESISQFFHILDSVTQPRGCVCLGDGRYQITNYCSCCNLERGIYYYTTYGNRQITALYLREEDLDGTKPVLYRPVQGQQILRQNRR